MKKTLILSSLMPLAACSVTPAEFEAFCRDNYRVTVHDAGQWERYTAQLIQTARQEGVPARLDDSAPFELRGQFGAEHRLLFPEPVPLTYRVLLEGQTVATISDFSAEVSDRPHGPSSCDRFDRHTLHSLFSDQNDRLHNGIPETPTRPLA